MAELFVFNEGSAHHRAVSCTCWTFHMAENAYNAVLGVTLPRQTPYAVCLVRRHSDYNDVCNEQDADLISQLRSLDVYSGDITLLWIKRTAT